MATDPFAHANVRSMWKPSSLCGTTCECVRSIRILYGQAALAGAAYPSPQISIKRFRSGPGCLAFAEQLCLSLANAKFSLDRNAVCTSACARLTRGRICVCWSVCACENDEEGEEDNKIGAAVQFVWSRHFNAHEPQASNQFRHSDGIT